VVSGENQNIKVYRPTTMGDSDVARSNFYSSMFQRRGSISIPRDSLSGEVQYLFSEVPVGSPFSILRRLMYLLIKLFSERRLKFIIVSVVSGENQNIKVYRPTTMGDSDVNLNIYSLNILA
jgi:hypothetical protein